MGLRPKLTIQRLVLPTRERWRDWLGENHRRVLEGVWLVYYKKGSGKRSIAYEASVEEALCFGWVDSLIKRIDDQAYCRKFTPRKNDSQWSAVNKRRVEKIIGNGTITRFGLAKVETAKRLGTWEKNAAPSLDWSVPQELAAALAQDLEAKDFFESLAPSYQKFYIGWVASAKREETRLKRVAESLEKLRRGEKLGMK